MYSCQSHFIINVVLTEPKLARSLVKFTVLLISYFAMNIIIAKTFSTVKVEYYSAKCHNFSNLPKFLVLQTDSTDTECGKVTTPAVSILQSTERVANVIATTLSRTKPSFTIARPNLGMPAHMYKITYSHLTYYRL